MRGRKRLRKQPLSSEKNNTLRENHIDDDTLDALTAEPLHPVKYVKVTSPDGSLVLRYNTSSLIKVAEYKGGFMQPPHFMEPMNPELIEEVEKIEGKSFVFTSSLKHIFDGADIFTHQLARFDDMMDEFYLLSPLDIFVCPLCYEHYLWTRYITSLTESERRKIERSSEREIVPIDPLDVLDHMKNPSSSRDPETSSPILFIAFNQGKTWKQHMAIHHNRCTSSAGDHRVRDLLCTYFSAYNREKRQEAETARKKRQAPLETPLLTQQRYWAKNACYNKLRYNRLLKFIEEGSQNLGSVTSTTAFPDEHLQDQYEIDNDQSNCSDFINDDDTSSSGEYLGPHYSSPSADDDGGDSSRESTDSSENSRDSSQTLQTATSTDDDDPFHSKQNAIYDAKQSRWILPKHGTPKVKHLLVEEELFLEAASEKKVSSTSLYDPLMHKIHENDTDTIDFEHLGEDIPTVTTLIKYKESLNDATTSRDPEVESLGQHPAVEKHESKELANPTIDPVQRTSGKLLLDDE